MHFFGRIGGPEPSLFKVSYACNFQNHASHCSEEHFFNKNDQTYREEGAMRDKKTKKTADGTRNSKKCRCDAYTYFCRAVLEAKNARDCSQKLLFEGGMDRKIANQTSKGTTRASKRVTKGLKKAV